MKIDQEEFETAKFLGHQITYHTEQIDQQRDHSNNHLKYFMNWKLL